ncbi:MAG TPA: hypothetical protein VLI93_15080 [Acetobacteraceae bacterium]|nr:hypothetical protein [Acetobacteraceae bacterium]
MSPAVKITRTDHTPEQLSGTVAPAMYQPPRHLTLGGIRNRLPI